MSDICIRKAKREDCFAIMELKKELAGHQNMGDLPMLSVEELQRDGFDVNPPCYECLVAEAPECGDDGKEIEPRQMKVMGYALYFYAFAVWLGKALHLEDLCVSKSARGKGLGSKLMKELAKVAVNENCSRMQLEVLDSNESAIKFYDAHGGWNSTTGEGWHNFRIDRAATELLATDSS